VCGSKKKAQCEGVVQLKEAGRVRENRNKGSGRKPKKKRLFIRGEKYNGKREERGAPILRSSFRDQQTWGENGGIHGRSH